MTKVTIITIVYKVEKFIEQCITSLMEQSFEDIEFVIINDCTPDLSIEITKAVVEKYPSRKNHVKIINQEKNLGSGAARALGVNNATGKYIIHVDSDDYCEPNMIQRLYEKAIESDADIVICDYFVNFFRSQTYRSQIPVSSGMVCLSHILSGKMHAATWNKFIKRSLYVNNDINYIEGIDMWEDISTVSRLCYFANKVAYLPEAFLHYRQTNSNSYTSKLNDKSIQSMVNSIEEVINFLKKQDALDYFDFEINYLKLNAKCVWLKETKGIVQRNLLNKYPESANYELCHPTLPRHYRYALWLTKKNQFWLANSIVIILGNLRKIRDKL